MIEIWKQIKEYEDYEVSSLGNVRSRKYSATPRILVACKIGRGYPSVALSKDKKIKRFLVHRLVASAFIENRHNVKVINHIDENITNNATTNLEWCSQKENVRRYKATRHNKLTCGTCKRYAEHIGDKLNFPSTER